MRALRAGEEKVGPGTHCLRMCQNTLEFWGIVTLRTFSDIFVTINGRGMYCASIRVTVKLAFLVLPVLSCLPRVSFLDFEG